MKYSCETIKDLLPLYHDNVCSDSSRRIVEEHLLECDSCKRMMERINDNTYDNQLQEERKNVIGNYTKKVKRKSMVVGICIASVLSIPILVCLIVNIATGHGLDWFFIVLASLMVFASLVAVPLIVEAKKGLWTLGSFTISLLLLLFVCCIYSGGNWFFVASVPILFGLSVIFLPYVIYEIPLKGFAAKNKGLIVMIIDTILLYAVIIVSGLYANPVDYWMDAFLITTVCLIFPWVLFLTIRYLKTNRFIKTGICFIFSGIFISLISDVIHWIIDGTLGISLFDANLGRWGNHIVTNGNIYLIVLLSGCIVGGIFLALGLTQKRKSR